MSDRHHDHADDSGEHDDDYDVDDDVVVVVVVVTVSNALWKLCQVQLVPQQGHHDLFHQGTELF